jgi:hypothetical protein
MNGGHITVDPVRCAESHQIRVLNQLQTVHVFNRTSPYTLAKNERKCKVNRSDRVINAQNKDAVQTKGHARAVRNVRQGHLALLEFQKKWGATSPWCRGVG